MQRSKGDPFSNAELVIECHYRLYRELFTRCKNLLYLHHSPFKITFCIAGEKKRLFIDQNLVSEHIG